MEHQNMSKGWKCGFIISGLLKKITNQPYSTGPAFLVDIFVFHTQRTNSSFVESIKRVDHFFYLLKFINQTKTYTQ